MSLPTGARTTPGCRWRAAPPPATWAARCKLCCVLRSVVSTVALHKTLLCRPSVLRQDIVLYLQVHLRLQWRENEREAEAEATARFSFEVR